MVSSNDNIRCAHIFVKMRHWYVSNAEACESAVQRCVAEFDSIDVLVNVAGTYPISPVLEMTEAEPTGGFAWLTAACPEVSRR